MGAILLVDDHPIIVKACRELLEDAGFTAIFEAHDALSACQAFLHRQPKVVVVDLALHGDDLGGLAVIQRIRSHDPTVGILVFSMHTDPHIVASAIEAGATGYLPKDAPPDELIKAIEVVQSGGRYLSQKLALKVILRTEPGGPVAALTSRERQTLTLLAEGRSYGSIADQLGVSYKTVVNLTYRLRRKLGARGFSDLIRLAVELMRPKA